MILVDGQMHVYNLFVDRFCLKPFIVQGANNEKQFTQEAKNREPSINQMTKDK